MNEAEARTEYIDPALKGGGPGRGCKDAGRGVVEGSRILRECPITRGRLSTELPQVAKGLQCRLPSDLPGEIDGTRRGEKQFAEQRAIGATDG